MDEGLFAELADLDALRRAVGGLRAHGHRRIDAFMPIPDPQVLAAIGPRRSSIPRIGGIAALCGIAVGYGLQWWLAASLYPLDVGGRPPHSPLAFVPITFESAVLLAAFATFFAVLGLSGLPRLWRPAFEIEGFHSEAYWVFVSVEDPRFDRVRVEARLRELGALRVVAIPEDLP
jgi:hypothetical protein